MTVDGIIFDFDGVLVESEYIGSVQLARTLTDLGYPTTVEQALTNFVGVGGPAFVDAVAHYIGGPVPQAFFDARAIEDARVLAEGVDAVPGAIDFVAALPGELPRAIASSSTTEWIQTHLRHIGLHDAFAPHIYSGREHVARGKPAPDIYLYAAEQHGLDITRTLIIEDSPVGIAGASASGARVVALVAGRHCGPGYAERLRLAGAATVVSSFDEIAALLRP